MLKFTKQYLLNLKCVGSIVPSSKYLAKKMIEGIPQEKYYKILEVGGGTGAITKFIINDLNKSNEIYVSELNPLFCDILEKKFEKKINIIKGDILEYKPINREFDYIICSLPFNSLNFEITKKIYDHLFKLLKNNGNLIIFEYRLLNKISCNNKYRNYKKNYLDKFLIEQKKENRNIPPAIVKIYRKNG